MAPRVVAQLVAVAGDEPGRVRVLREPRADREHRAGGAAVGERREDPPGEVEIARTVEGERDLGSSGRGVDQLAGGPAGGGGRSGQRSGQRRGQRSGQRSRPRRRRRTGSG